MLTDYRSGWWGHGLGSTTPVPTGVALTALASTMTLFHMGLLHTVGVLGLLLVGYLGIWRLASLFPTGAGADRCTRRVRGGAPSVAAALQWPMGVAGLLCDGSVGGAPTSSQRGDRVVRQQPCRQDPVDSSRADAYVRSRRVAGCGCCANWRC